MTARTVLIAFVTAMFAAGCGSTTLPRPGGGNSQDDAQAQRIRQLEERVLELQRQAAMTQVELDNLRREVTELRGGTPSTRSNTRRPSSSSSSSATPRNRDTVTERPSQPVTGERERQATARGVEGRQGEIEVEDIDPPPPPVRQAEPRQPARESAAGFQEPQEPQEPQRALELETSEPAGTGVARDAQAQYDRGYTLYHQGRYVDAETAFQQFLQSHGDSELADNAQYWIGESRAARGDSNGALLAFREAVTRFPDGNKVPDSMLKVGDTLADLGDRQRAAEAYRQLIAEFPDTAAAAAAAERLRSLP
jgi:tol-pal system protein YbgF